MGSEGENKMREGAVGFEKGKEEMMGEGTENCGHAGEGSQGSGLVALIFSVGRGIVCPESWMGPGGLQRWARVQDSCVGRAEKRCSS